MYAGMVETFDNAVRIVLDALDRHAVADRTLVILTSDHGGVSTSEGWPTSNSPFRAGQGWLYEGGFAFPPSRGCLDHPDLRHTRRRIIGKSGTGAILFGTPVVGHRAPGF